MSGTQNEEARARSEARVKQQEQRAAEARKVNEQVAAEGVAERAKTARLRALRLAKEEAEQASSTPKPARSKAKSAKKAS